MNTNLDKASPGVEITLGGKKYSLKFGYNAIARIERALGGKSLIEIVQQQPPSVTTIIALIWGGINPKETGDLTMDKVGDMLEEHGLQEIAEKIVGPALEQIMITAKLIKKNPAEREAAAVVETPESIG